jgi:uncharacterized protein YceH (UPF0502 family)
MDLEQRILQLEERVAAAEVDGRNPIAIQAKFENAFQLISELQNKFDDLNLKVANISAKLDKLLIEEPVEIIEEKRKPGRPARQEV